MKSTTLRRFLATIAMTLLCHTFVMAVTYQVSFLNDDGSVLQSRSYNVGDVPEYEGDTPTKAPDAQYSYVFKGWNYPITAVTADAAYMARYAEIDNYYEIKFLNENGVLLQSLQIKYNEIPVYSGPTPTKTPDVQYSYVFTGWDKEPTAVTGPAEYRAMYDNALNEYQISFVNYDGTVLKSSKIYYGYTPQEPETPSRPSDVQYSYTFKGWNPTIEPVTGEAIYKAEYDATVNKYTVSFLNEGGTELQSDMLDYGDSPVYRGENPEKAATAQYSYKFKGWDKSLATVTGPADYTATYESSLNKYKISYVNYDDTELQSSEVYYGSTPQYTGATPLKPSDVQYSYTFKGWDSAEEPVDGEAIYKAEYDATVNKYTVRFLNYDGTVLQSDQIEYGAQPDYVGSDPEKEADVQYTYVFKGWDKTLVTVTGDVDYRATYASVTNTYEVRFVNYDGVVLQSKDVEYGVVPVYTGETPTKAADDQYSYTFKEWIPEISEVLGTVTYVASYTPVLNSYTVTTKAEKEGVTSGDGIYEYGSKVVLTATPNERYEFVRWSNDETTEEITITVKEDVTLTAYFQFKHCVIEKDIVMSVAEDAEITLKSGAVIKVTENMQFDDLKITPLECDTIFHYNITMIRQTADNTPACNGASSLSKYDWLLMVNVVDLKKKGYMFEESDIAWYRVKGTIDNLDAPESERTDELVAKGSGYTIDQSLAGAGEYYALINLPLQTTNMGCKGGIMRTKVYQYKGEASMKPSLTSTIVAPGEPIEINNLPSDEDVEISVYDYIGRLYKSFTTKGSAKTLFSAESLPGNYVVIIKTASGTESVKYIVK